MLKLFIGQVFFLPKEVLKKCSHLYDSCRTLDDIADKKGKLNLKKKKFEKFKSNFKKKKKKYTNN